MERQNRARILKAELSSDIEGKINLVKELIGLEEFARAKQILDTLPEKSSDDKNYLHAVISSLQKDSAKATEYLSHISHQAELRVIKSRITGVLIEPKEALAVAKDLRKGGNEFLANYCKAAIANSLTIENVDDDTADKLIAELKQTQHELRKDINESIRKEEEEIKKEEEEERLRKQQRAESAAMREAAMRAMAEEQAKEAAKREAEEIRRQTRIAAKEAFQKVLTIIFTFVWLLVAYILPWVWMAVIIVWLMFYNHSMGVINKFMTIVPLGMWMLAVVLVRVIGLSEGAEHYLHTNKGFFNRISTMWWLLYPFMTLTVIYRTYFACMEVSGADPSPVSCFFTCVITWILTLPSSILLLASCDRDDYDREKNYMGAIGLGVLLVIIIHGLYLLCCDTTMSDIIKGVFYIVTI